MIYSNEEALLKFCPMVGFKKCVGEKCMMWRHDSTKVIGYKDVIHTIGDACGIVREPICQKVGYCGMGGLI